MVGQFIKNKIANQSSHVNVSQVTVELNSNSQLSSSPLIVDAQVEMQSAADFKKVRQALKDHENIMQTEITDYFNNTPAIEGFKTSDPVSITGLVFNFTKAVFLTTTTTSSETDETTTTSGTHQIRMLGTMLAWLAACYIQL